MEIFRIQVNSIEEEYKVKTQKLDAAVDEIRELKAKFEEKAEKLTSELIEFIES